jgi:hypothetical protein
MVVQLRRAAVAIWIFAGLLWIIESMLLMRAVDHHGPIPVATVTAVFAATVTLLACHFWSWGAPAPYARFAGRRAAAQTPEERAYWQAYSDVAEDVLGRAEGPDDAPTQ